ncbi:MAG: hypothetical protein M3317_05075, partial [Actinomycetota bacterium]|nr:hypothetical protein [Actinomycetota bacterium]
LIRKTNERFEQEKQRVFRAGRADAAQWRRRLDGLERQRANYQRAYSADALSLSHLKARSAELDAEQTQVEQLLAEHEGREDRLRHLEATRDKSVEQIKRGEWGKLGITAPEARQERYREIGLKAEAAADGTVHLSWGMGEEVVLGTTDPNPPGRIRARCPPIRQT